MPGKREKKNCYAKEESDCIAVLLLSCRAPAKLDYTCQCKSDHGNHSELFSEEKKEEICLYQKDKKC